MIEDENIKDDNVEAEETETPEAPEINHVSNMVSQLVDGDNVAAQDSFKNALTDKIGSALDDKRKTVANDWLNATVGNEEETETEDGKEPTLFFPNSTDERELHEGALDN